MFIVQSCLILNFICNNPFFLEFFRSNTMRLKILFIIIAFCIFLLIIIKLNPLDSYVYMSSRQISISDILNPSSTHGSPQPPSPQPPNLPDSSTGAMIATNSGNTQENTPIFPNTANNLSNTSTQIGQGIQGKIIYFEKNGQHFLRFVNDRNGELITRFNRDNLPAGVIEWYAHPVPGGRGNGLNVTNCEGVTTGIYKSREGIWIPDMRRAGDVIKGPSNNNLPLLDGRLFLRDR